MISYTATVSWNFADETAEATTRQQSISHELTTQRGWPSNDDYTRRKDCIINAP